MNWPHLKTGHAVQQFPGIVNYFRLYIANSVALIVSLDVVYNYKTIADND